MKRIYVKLLNVSWGNDQHKGVCVLAWEDGTIICRVPGGQIAEYIMSYFFFTFPRRHFGYGTKALEEFNSVLKRGRLWENRKN